MEITYQPIEQQDVEKIFAYLKELILRYEDCLLYTSPSPRDMRRSRMPSSA